MATNAPDTGDGRRGSSRRSDERGTDARVERGKQIAAAAFGGALLVRGLRRRSLSGLATGLAGGWLLSRALRGGRRRGEGGGPSAPAGRGAVDRSGDTDAAAVSRSVTVGRPADELYEMWRDPDQFSQIMGDVADVTSAGEGRLSWTVSGPRGRDISWETHLVEEEPGESLRWETSAGAVVPTEGSVRFRPAPADRGTEVTLSISFDPPGGALGNAALSRLGAVPEALAGTALDRFKSLAESGEIPTLEGNSSARGAGDRV